MIYVQQITMQMTNDIKTEIEHELKTPVLAANLLIQTQLNIKQKKAIKQIINKVIYSR